MQTAWQWVLARSTLEKIVLALLALVVVVLLSPLLAVLAPLALLVSLAVLLFNLLRRRPIKRWGIAAAASLALLVVAAGASNAVYGPSEEPVREQAIAPEATTETTEEQADAASEQAEAEAARQDATEAKEEAEVAREEAAQAKEEAEEAEAARAEAEAAPKEPAPKADENENTDTVTIRVTGTPGIPFSGSYGNIDSQRSVDGVIPQDFETEVETGFLAFDSVTAVMQNRGGGGELRVEIVVDGDVKKEESTTAEFGVVSLNYVPGE